MEDIVLCYDTLSPDAIKFARLIYESTMMILEVNVTHPSGFFGAWHESDAMRSQFQTVSEHSNSGTST